MTQQRLEQATGLLVPIGTFVLAYCASSWGGDSSILASRGYLVSTLLGGLAVLGGAWVFQARRSTNEDEHSLLLDTNEDVPQTTQEGRHCISLMSSEHHRPTGFQQTRPPAGPLAAEQIPKPQPWWSACFPFFPSTPALEKKEKDFASPGNGMTSTNSLQATNGSAVYVHSTASRSADALAAACCQDEGKMHPKFCGLRILDPAFPGVAGEDSHLDVSPFPPEPLGTFPPEWTQRLSASEEELELCERLHAAVEDYPGPKDPITLLRFLRARKGNINLASEMYRKAMDLRFGPKVGFERRFRAGQLDISIHRMLDPFWCVNGMLGFDKDGDPVLYERLGITKTALLANAPKEFLIRHQAYTMTRTLQALEEAMRVNDRPFVSLTVVQDLTGLNLGQIGSPTAMSTYNAIIRLCEDNYPEMMKRCLVIYPPAIFERAWSMVKHFFDEGTRDKIQVIKSDDTKNVLSKYIDEAWIPVKYGGQLRICNSDWCEPILPRPVKGAPPEVTKEIIEWTKRQASKQAKS